MFHMPQRFGGVAFPSPDLNSPFKPGEYQRAVTSKSSYRCDLYWSEHNLAVEYDSDDYHTGSDRIADDAERRNSSLTWALRPLPSRNISCTIPSSFSRWRRLSAKAWRARAHQGRRPVQAQRRTAPASSVWTLARVRFAALFRPGSLAGRFGRAGCAGNAAARFGCAGCAGNAAAIVTGGFLRAERADQYEARRRVVL